MPPQTRPNRDARAPELLARLREAQDDHDQIRRATRAGVTADALRADNLKWERLGVALAALAATIRDSCAASAFCDSRPPASALAARMSESLDDLIDEPAWMVIDAAARLAGSGA